VPLDAGLQKIANFSTLIVGLDGTGYQTWATCVAGSGTNGCVESLRMESRRKWFFHKTGITLQGGKQCIVWNLGVSDFVAVEYGVRQGSILGPVLFLLHVADMDEYLGTNNSTVVYADD
jgi:hypothetical protein